MRLFTIYKGKTTVDIYAEKVEFEWNTATALFLIGENVVGGAREWDTIVSVETEETDEGG